MKRICWPPQLLSAELRFHTPEPGGKSRCFWFERVATGEMLLVKLPDWHDRSRSYRLAEMGSELAAHMLGHLLQFRVARAYRVELTEGEMAAHYHEFQPNGQHVMLCVASVDVAGGRDLLTAEDYLGPRLEGGRITRVLSPAQYAELLSRRQLRQFIRLSIWDAFIGNEDRHYRNWAFTSASGSASLATYFDHGSAFFGLLDNGAYKYPVENWYQSQRRRLDTFLAAKMAELESAMCATGTRLLYTHDQLLAHFRTQHPDVWAAEAGRYRDAFQRLTPELIERVVGHLAGLYWTQDRASFVTRYLQLRRDRMLEWL